MLSRANNGETNKSNAKKYLEMPNLHYYEVNVLFYCSVYISISVHSGVVK